MSVSVKTISSFVVVSGEGERERIPPHARALNSLPTGGQFETISVLQCVALIPPVNKGRLACGDCLQFIF